MILNYEKIKKRKKLQAASTKPQAALTMDLGFDRIKL